MPCYPALALLLGCAMVGPAARGIHIGQGLVAAMAALGAIAIVFILSQVWSLPTPGDISRALTQNPDAYTLSLGHMGDLTMASFAYLRLPLIVAGVALTIGAAGLIWRRGVPGYFATALMMALFLCMCLQ